MSLHLGTTQPQREALSTLPTTDSAELHIGVDGGIVSLSVDRDRRVPVITTTLRTPDANTVLASCYNAITGSVPQVRIDTQQTARLWVGNIRVQIPAAISGLVAHWLAEHIQSPKATRQLPPEAQALSAALEHAA